MLYTICHTKERRISGKVHGEPVGYNTADNMTVDEARQVTHMARRIAAIMLLYPALDVNYRTVKQATIPRTSLSKHG